jgi:hypothetical protein
VFIKTIPVSLLWLRQLADHPGFHEMVLKVYEHLPVKKGTILVSLPWSVIYRHSGFHVIIRFFTNKNCIRGNGCHSGFSAVVGNILPLRFPCHDPVNFADTIRKEEPFRFLCRGLLTATQASMSCLDPQERQATSLKKDHSGFSVVVVLVATQASMPWSESSRIFSNCNPA